MAAGLAAEHQLALSTQIYYLHGPMWASNLNNLKLVTFFYSKNCSLNYQKNLPIMEIRLFFYFQPIIQ